MHHYVIISPSSNTEGLAVQECVNATIFLGVDATFCTLKAEQGQKPHKLHLRLYRLTVGLQLEFQC